MAGSNIEGIQEEGSRRAGTAAGEVRKRRRHVTVIVRSWDWLLDLKLMGSETRVPKISGRAE